MAMIELVSVVVVSIEAGGRRAALPSSSAR
jgi:hypothetical protein